jgi:hypothetical protein
MIDEEFNEWIESIKFVDEEGNVLPVVLTEDVSPDPENDRAEEE